MRILTLDNATYDLDHLLTRVAMMVYIKNELEKASITALPESNPED